MANKEEIIAKVYFDPAGFGSINETLKYAKKYDKTITYDDVKRWKVNKHSVNKPRQEVRTASLLTSHEMNTKWTCCSSLMNQCLLKQHF